LLPKRLELLRELVPALNQVAVFVNPANPSRTDFLVRETESAGRTMGLQIQIFHTGTIREINASFTRLASQRPDALLVAPDPFFLNRRAQIATLAARHGLPTSFAARDYVEAGGLMSYGPNINDAFRQAGIYIGRVLKGAKVADLPVVQSTKFELVINAQTALMLGLTVPDKPARCRCRVAPRGARTAAGDTGDRVPQRRIAQRVRAHGGCVPSGSEGHRLCRGPERED
jgi:ABC-type uncharacterized transport system substrate-binding protein